MDSLSILNPHPWASSFDNAKDPIVDTLKKMAIQLCLHIKYQEWTHPDWSTHLTPDFCAFIDHAPCPQVSSREEYIAHHKAIADANPNYDCDLISISVNVNEKSGLADILMTLKIYNDPEGMQKESSTIVSARRKPDGNWVAVRSIGIRGAALE